MRGASASCPAALVLGDREEGVATRGRVGDGEDGVQRCELLKRRDLADLRIGQVRCPGYVVEAREKKCAFGWPRSAR